MTADVIRFQADSGTMQGVRPVRGRQCVVASEDADERS